MPSFYSDRQPVTVDDVIPGYILAADVSSVTSVGGGGKGLLSVDIMARITRGWPPPPYMSDDPLIDPDDFPTPGYVLHCPREDDPDRTVWHRLNAAGADMTKVALLENLRLPEDLGRLRGEIDDLGDCRMVIVDPWMAAATTTTSFNQQMRHTLLEPLVEQARDTGVGTWIVHHFTKGTNGGRLGAGSSKSLTDYVAGSKGFTDTLRMNTVVVDSDLDPRVKVWKTLKANGGGGGDLEYMICAERPGDPDAHIRWRQPQVTLNDPRVFDRITERVAAELAAAPGPVTPQAMAALTRLPFTLVNRAMASLAASGAAVKRRGAYTAQDAISPARAAAVPAIGGRLGALLRDGKP